MKYPVYHWLLYNRVIKSLWNGTTFWLTLRIPLTSHQQRGHTETVSSERPEKREIDLAITELVV